jgi:ABC-type uncharacterized transport system auxiliary subunit
MRFAAKGALLLALSLAGCGTSPPVPETTYHQLPLPPVAADPAARLVERINVLPFQADDLRHDRAFVYSLSAPHLTLQQSHYHYWVDPPPRLLQQHLADWLTARSMARFVTTEPYADAAADLWVRGRIVRLERESDGAGERVRIALELRAGVPGNQAPVAQRLIDVSEPLPAGATIDSVVQAFAEALERVWVDFGEALRGAVTRGDVGLR